MYFERCLKCYPKQNMTISVKAQSSVFLFFPKLFPVNEPLPVTKCEKDTYDIPVIVFDQEGNP